jgi:predicted metalloprotease with PDZ domain
MRLITTTLLATTLVACQSSGAGPAPEVLDDGPLAATLGVTTSIPSKELAQEMELEFQVRQQGRFVDSVALDGAASRAGIRTGDVLLELGDVTLYSQDDIDDFLYVNEPETRVRATVVRKGTSERKELSVTLGAGAARGTDGIEWQYASLAQLPAALDQARAEKKKVLVGLSGAET